MNTTNGLAMFEATENELKQEWEEIMRRVGITSQEECLAEQFLNGQYDDLTQEEFDNSVEKFLAAILCNSVIKLDYDDDDECEFYTGELDSLYEEATKDIRDKYLYANPSILKYYLDKVSQIMSVIKKCREEAYIRYDNIDDRLAMAASFKTYLLGFMNEDTPSVAVKPKNKGGRPKKVEDGSIPFFTCCNLNLTQAYNLLSYLRTRNWIDAEDQDSLLYCVSKGTLGKQPVHKIKWNGKVYHLAMVVSAMCNKDKSPEWKKAENIFEGAKNLKQSGNQAQKTNALWDHDIRDLRNAIYRG